MKIEVGKAYKTRAGRKAFIEAAHACFDHMFEGTIAGSTQKWRWKEDGLRHGPSLYSITDLVAPWEEPETVAISIDDMPTSEHTVKPLQPQVGDIVHVRARVTAVHAYDVPTLLIDGTVHPMAVPISEILFIEPRKPCAGDTVAWDGTSPTQIIAIDGDKWWCRLAYGQDAIWLGSEKMSHPGFHIVSRGKSE